MGGRDGEDSEEAEGTRWVVSVGHHAYAMKADLVHLALAAK